MKTFLILLVLSSGLLAQGQTIQYIALFNTNDVSSASVAVQTNQLVTYLSVNGGVTYLNGAGPGFTCTMTVGYSYCGFTNVTLTTSSGSCGRAFVQITTPASATSASTVVTNFLPADCVVIPASATGNVQVILESSPDLVAWTAASPGTYSAANGSTRFFRVRALTQ